MQESLSALEACVTANPNAASGPLRQLAGDARKALAARLGSSAYAETGAQNLGLAERLWSARVELCGSGGENHEALSRVLSQASQ